MSIEKINMEIRKQVLAKVVQLVLVPKRVKLYNSKFDKKMVHKSSIEVNITMKTTVSAPQYVINTAYF